MVSVEAREWTRLTKAINRKKTAEAVLDAMVDGTFEEQGLMSVCRKVDRGLHQKGTLDSGTTRVDKR